jgi:hypothetical protein
MIDRKATLIRELTNVRGELLLMKRAQRRLQEQFDLVVRSQAGMASLMAEQRSLLQELVMADGQMIGRTPSRGVGERLKKAA